MRLQVCGRLMRARLRSAASMSQSFRNISVQSIWGACFCDPMTGTAASMQIEENMALAARRGLSRTLKKRNQQQRTGILQGAPGRAGTGAGGSYDLQSWSAFWWSETGTDTSDGYPEKPQLLLLDEHTAALDPKTAAKVLGQQTGLLDRTT